MLPCRKLQVLCTAPLLMRRSVPLTQAWKLPFQIPILLSVTLEGKTTLAQSGFLVNSLTREGEEKQSKTGEQRALSSTRRAAGKGEGHAVGWCASRIKHFAGSNCCSFIMKCDFTVDLQSWNSSTPKLSMELKID